MTTQQVANDLVAMWKAGDFRNSGEKYWAEDVVSIEAGAPEGMDPVSRGKSEARGKGEWWASAHEVHSSTVAGPYVNGDQFIVRFTMDITVKESGQRMSMDEMGLYTVKNGKIVEWSDYYR